MKLYTNQVKAIKNLFIVPQPQVWDIKNTTLVRTSEVFAINKLRLCPLQGIKNNEYTQEMYIHNQTVGLKKSTQYVTSKLVITYKNAR
jgi:hypothetical protein